MTEVAVAGTGSTASSWTVPPVGGFCHQALFYGGDDDFLAAVVPFVRYGLELGQPVLAVLGADHLTALREAMGADAASVALADMGEVGANPARIIPAWQAFLDGFAPGVPVRGIGEPIHPGREGQELVECHRHEALLNLTFPEASPFWLLCPYDTRSLATEVLEEAERNHPVTYHRDTGPVMSRSFGGLEALAGPFDEPLPPAPEQARPLAVVAGLASSLGQARELVAHAAAAAGLGAPATVDLQLAVNEIVTNSLRHGGGRGELRVWPEGDTLICEVRDQGRLTEPLAGRRTPAASATTGRGLWMATQLCDLLQIRCFPEGTVVRLHMRLRS